MTSVWPDTSLHLGMIVERFQDSNAGSPIVDPSYFHVCSKDNTWLSVRIYSLIAIRFTETDHSAGGIVSAP